MKIIIYTYLDGSKSYSSHKSIFGGKKDAISSTEEIEVDDVLGGEFFDNPTAYTIEEGRILSNPT